MKIIRVNDMKELNQYQCEICGIVYRDRLVAEKCEASHILPKFRKPIIGFKFHKEAKYPDYVMIEFNDGAVGRYKRS